MDTESKETLHDAALAYLEQLKVEGKKERTLATYGRDFQQIMDHFGVERKLASILPQHVGKFLKSDELLKLPGGNPCRFEFARPGQTYSFADDESESENEGEDFGVSFPAWSVLS